LPQAVANEPAGVPPPDDLLERLARRARTLARDVPDGDDITREELAKLARALDNANLVRLARRARIAVTAIEERDLDLAAEQMAMLVECLLERVGGRTPPRPPPAAPPSPRASRSAPN
jgi:hypothetical protein